MALKILDNRRVRQVITLLAVAAMALVMLPIEAYWCMWWSSHAEHIAGTFLLIGLFLLVFDKINLMFVMMFCSAGICLFLMRNANDQLYHSSPTDLPFIKLAHFNVNNAAGEAEDFLKSVVSTNADVVSIQEVTPVWDSILINRLMPLYPYNICLPDIGTNGIVLFSRLKFEAIDTIYYKESPNLKVIVRPENATTDIVIIASVMEPVLSGRSAATLRLHLAEITKRIAPLNLPYITLGEYNTVSWNEAMVQFRTDNGLSDSRRGITPTTNTTFPLADVPIDHIMYSTKHFNCVDFTVVGNQHSSHVGIFGTYQFKATDNVPKKTR